jgi:pyrroloquinoline quinone biosynthesis protein B
MRVAIGRLRRLAPLLSALAGCSTPAVGSVDDPSEAPGAPAADDAPYIVVLGVAQDGGVPQAGNPGDPAWDDPVRRKLTASLALVDPVSGERWMFDATPDFRAQLQRLDRIAPCEPAPGLAGIFLTHAHIGHYTGLMFLGHESMGSSGVPVFAMPRMAEFLRSNGPWSQLVRLGNIALHELADGATVRVNPRLSVTPLRVPHRQEFSEVVGFRIEGPTRSVLFIPDIDSWEEWDELGTNIEDVLRDVDVAYLDGTFYSGGEIPGRDMSGFPHPFIRHSMKRFASLPAELRARVRFIHLNHTNPALDPSGEARGEIEKNGYHVADELERVGL